MDQVPAIMQIMSGSVTPAASAQALMSNMPPMTGVPGSSPQRAAASSLTRPQISDARQSGGSAGSIASSPNRASSSRSKARVCRFMRFAPE